jgi:hypothetical protein
MELPADLFTELAEQARYEPVASARATERRKVPRVQITMDAAIVRLNAGSNVKPMTVTIRDLSVRGVGIECGERFHVTEMFALRFAREGAPPVWVQCEVMRWLPIAANRFAVGARFEKMLTGATPEAKASAA